MCLLWRERVDTLSQLRARDNPGGFSVRKEADLLSPLILMGVRVRWIDDQKVSLEQSSNQEDPQMTENKRPDHEIAKFPEFSIQIGTPGEIIQFKTIPFTKESSATDPHQDSDPDNLNSQLLPPSFRLCITNKKPDPLISSPLFSSFVPQDSGRESQTQRGNYTIQQSGKSANLKTSERLLFNDHVCP